MTNIESMSEIELRELIRNAEEALDRLVAKRARSTLKEAKRTAEVGYEITFEVPDAVRAALPLPAFRTTT